MALATIACNFDPNFNNGLPLPADGHKTGINDLYINPSGNFVILTGLLAVQQAITQWMQLWLGEWFFNSRIGYDYDYYFNSDSDQAQSSFEIRIREGFAPYSGSTDVWHCSENWNAYLKQNHSDADYNEWKTQVTDITQIYDKENGILAVKIYLQFGNGLTEVVVVNINNTDIIVNELSVKDKFKLSSGFVANQNLVNVQIQTPDNWVIESGELMVRLKVGGLYSNAEPILCSEYIGRLLPLPLKMSTGIDTTMQTDWKYLAKYVKVINVL